MERDTPGGSDVGRDLGRDFGDEPAPAIRDARPTTSRRSTPLARSAATCPRPNRDVADGLARARLGAREGLIYPAFRPVGTQGLDIESLDRDRLSRRAPSATPSRSSMSARPACPSSTPRCGRLRRRRQRRPPAVVGSRAGGDPGSRDGQPRAMVRPAPWTDEISGDRRLVSSDTGDGWDAARILLPEVVAHLTPELAPYGRILVGLPERHLLTAASLRPTTRSSRRSLPTSSSSTPAAPTSPSTAASSTRRRPPRRVRRGRPRPDGGPGRRCRPSRRCASRSPTRSRRHPRPARRAQRADRRDEGGAAAAFRSIARDRSIRAVVLTGAGRAFCAGQDLKERQEPDAAPLAVELRERYNPIIRAMRALDQPIVGAINGVAAGAGASLASPATSGSPPMRRASCWRSGGSGWCPTAARPGCCRGWSAAPRPPSWPCIGTRSRRRTRSGSGWSRRSCPRTLAAEARTIAVRLAALAPGPSPRRSTPWTGPGRSISIGRSRRRPTARASPVRARTTPRGWRRSSRSGRRGSPGSDLARDPRGSFLITGPSWRGEVDDRTPARRTISPRRPRRGRPIQTEHRRRATGHDPKSYGGGAGSAST